MSYTFISNVSLYTGLAYLQGMVTYSFVVYDLPAVISSSSSFSNAASSSPPQFETAREHYCLRHMKHISYKMVPVACCLLTGGVLAKMVLERGSLPSLLTFAAAFATAYNNGRNVVNPIQQHLLEEGGKSEKSAKHHQVSLPTVLSGIARGHLLDMVGFTTVFVLATFL